MYVSKNREDKKQQTDVDLIHVRNSSDKQSYFGDNRTITITQRKLQEKIKNDCQLPIFSTISAISNPVQLFRIVKKYEDYEVVEFGRKEEKPRFGKYKGDGYIYEEDGGHQTGLFYKRRKNSFVSSVVEADIDEIQDDKPCRRLQIPTAVDKMDDKKLNNFIKIYTKDFLNERKLKDTENAFIQIYFKILEAIILDNVKQWWKEYGQQNPLEIGASTNFLGINVPPDMGIHVADVLKIRKGIWSILENSRISTTSGLYSKEAVNDAIYSKTYGSPEKLPNYERLKHDAEINTAEGKVADLVERLNVLERQNNRESKVEMNFYVNYYLIKESDNKDVPDPDNKVKLIVAAVAEQVKNQIASRRALSFKYDSTKMIPILEVQLPDTPEIGDSIESIEQNFDILSRKAAEPPENAIHEADMATFDTQRGLPADRVSATRNFSETTIDVVDKPPSEKAMAIGFRGAIDFKGKLSAGKVGNERIYATLFPKGAIRGWGMDRKKQNAPSLTDFKKEVRGDEDLNKLFVIRYETSTADEGQVHIYNEWLIEDVSTENVFYTQLELLRKYVIAVVEIEDKDNSWKVVKVTDFRSNYGILF